MKNVLLSYLHSDSSPISFQHSYLDLIAQDLSESQHLLTWARVRCGNMGIPEGRNQACEQFLKMEEAEWLFFLDSDMGFEPYVLDMLMSVADKNVRPIVGGLAFAWRQMGSDGMNGHRCIPQPTILDWIPEPTSGVEKFIGRTHYPANSLIKAGATGGACVLIHRSVIETVFERFGPHWFDRIRDEKDEFIGEDISFFVRTRELEIPLHIHTGIRTSHYKHLWVAEQDFWTSFLAPPAKFECDVIVPVLTRPGNIPQLMDSLRASTGLATAWFVCEDDDQLEKAAVIANGGRVLSHPDAHTFAEKVNYAYRQTSAPWLLLVGDDVRFRAGWLDQAQDIARRYLAQVVGTNDLCNDRVIRGEHATHPMISRSYIDQFGASWDGPGVVCHEGYQHFCVDDEIVTLAKQRGTFQAALAAQVEHVHPLNGQAPIDWIYELGMKYADEDKDLFRSRRDRFRGVAA